MTPRLALLVGFGVVLACSRTSPPGTEKPEGGAAPPAPPSATTLASTPAAVPSASAAPVDELRYETVTNPEIVPYCLPVPTSYLQEDRSERWEHGRKVFSKKAPPGRMDLLGFCVEKKLEAMFAEERKAIVAEAGAKLTVDALKADSYALSWSSKGRIHYEKTWAPKDDAGCFVRAAFEYDPGDQPTFGKVVAKVAAATPSCPK